MAKVENIVPFILYYEAGGAKSCFKTVTVDGKKKRVYDPSLLPFEKQFEECRKTGLANDPDDRGGLTMCGVTYATYAMYCNRKHIKATESGLKNLSYAVWLDILKTLFWDRWKADQIENQALANILVDWVWASGVTGIKRPQRILGVSADGIVGPKTLAAVNSSDPKKLFAELHADRLKHFKEIVNRAPSQRKFLKGWNRRVNGIAYEGFIYA